MRRPASRTRHLTGVAAGLLATALVLSACASDPDEDAEPTGTESPAPGGEATTAPEDASALEDIVVTGDVGSEPTLEFDTPFEVSGLAAIVETPGTGADLVEGQSLELNYVIVSGEDKSIVGSTWEQEQPDSFTFGDSQIVAQLTEALTGQKIGVRILFAVPGTEAQEATETSPEIPAQPTTIMALEVSDAVDVPSRAEGTAVEPPAGLPEVTLDDDGKPSIEIPADAEEPTELVDQVLIEGDGPVVESGQALKVHYSGWLFDGGEQFDSSWERGAPFDVTIGAGQVIPGWDEGLVGKPVGSQVLLVIPADKGYGDAGSPPTIPGGATLVFVVDILTAG